MKLTVKKFRIFLQWIQQWKKIRKFFTAQFHWKKFRKFLIVNFRLLKKFFSAEFIAKKIRKLFYSQFHWKNISKFFQKIRKHFFLPKKKRGWKRSFFPAKSDTTFRWVLTLFFFYFVFFHIAICSSKSQL